LLRPNGAGRSLRHRVVKFLNEFLNECWGAVLLGFAIFGLLWILDTPYREFYVPNTDDVPALADGLLLAPGARWEDWFTRGYSNYWDAYPEWPSGGNGFTRLPFNS
jgi:hypothetical protein